MESALNKRNIVLRVFFFFNPPNHKQKHTHTLHSRTQQFIMGTNHAESIKNIHLALVSESQFSGILKRTRTKNT